MLPTAIAADGDVGPALEALRRACATVSRRPPAGRTAATSAARGCSWSIPAAARVLDDDAPRDGRRRGVALDRRAQPRGARPPRDREHAAGVHVARRPLPGGVERGGLRRRLGPPGRAGRRARAPGARPGALAGVPDARSRGWSTCCATSPAAPSGATPPAIRDARGRRRPQRLRRRGLARRRDTTAKPRPSARLLAVSQPALGRRTRADRTALTSTTVAAGALRALARLPASRPPTGRWRYRAGPTFRQLDRHRRARRPPGRGDDLPLRGRGGPARRAASRCTRAVLADRCRRGERRRPRPGAPNRACQPPNADRAQREPAPAQGEAGDDVGQPVQVEQHAAARDGDGERRPRPRPGRPSRGRRRRRPEKQRARRRTRRRSTSGRSGTTARAWRRAGRSSAGRDRPRPSRVFVTSESPSVTTIRNGGIQRLGTRAHSIAPITTPIRSTTGVDARLETSRISGRVVSAPCRLGPSSRGGVDAGERVGPANSDREHADDRPASTVAASASVSARPVEDIRIEPAPDEPADGRVLADLRRDGGGRGTPHHVRSSRAGAPPRGEPGRCRDQDQDDDRHMNQFARGAIRETLMIVAVQQQTARADGHADTQAPAGAASGARALEPRRVSSRIGRAMAGHPVRAYLVVTVIGLRAARRRRRSWPAGHSRRTRFPSTASAIATST